MYLPAAFREADTSTIHDLIASYNFGTLISDAGGHPFANHVPFVLDRQGPWGKLRCHLARPNPQWEHFRSNREVLVIFQGPHAYVSPSWYETVPNVPTWNYVAVHAYGRARAIEDSAWLRQLLENLTRQHEHSLAQPWSMDQVPQPYVDGLLQGIVGVEIEITRLEGKWKLSQNRRRVDRQTAAEHLTSRGGAEAEVGRLMLDRLQNEQPAKPQQSRSGIDHLDQS